jgi:hypothetical protein
MTMLFKTSQCRSRMIRGPVAVAMVAVLLTGGVAAATRQGPPAHGKGRLLQGTWRVQITLRNCTTGEPVRPPFPALATFAAGGTVTTADGGLSPVARGTGHGIWAHNGGHNYEALTEAFLFTPAGIVSGTQRLRQTIDIGGHPDEFHATVSAHILDAGGTVVGSGCATSVGRRMEMNSAGRGEPASGPASLPPVSGVTDDLVTRRDTRHTGVAFPSNPSKGFQCEHVSHPATALRPHFFSSSLGSPR